MTNEEQPPISLKAIFHKATTTIDGGWRLSFDLSQDQREAVMNVSALTNLLLTLNIRFSEDF